MKLKMSRRSFIKHGSRGLIGIGMIPFLSKSQIESTVAGSKGEKMNLNDYYNHFEINEKIIREIKRLEEE